MLTIALPKGRLQRPALEKFARARVVPDEEPGTSRKLIVSAGPAARFVVLKDGDVPLYVERGAADLGVCGLDQVLESGADLLTPMNLGFGRCRLCLAAPRGKSVTAELGRSLRVATKYPRLTGQWFARRGVPVDLVHLSGSVELAAVSGLTDAIVDLVESGRTLDENGLVVVDELLQISARLVVNRAAYRLKVEEMLPLLEALRMIRILHLSNAADRAKALGLRASAGKAPEVPGAVAGIIADVRERGDVAVRALTERFDGARLDSLFLDGARWDALAAQCPAAVREALELAHRRVRAFHAPQLPPSYSMELADGGVLRSLVIPLRRAACYVPGGRAAYPSTVIMTVTVARLAGVPEVIVATPPRRDGTILPEVAAAARIAGASRVLLAGGAQAIAALALGTESVPQVDVIVGPGNAWVTEAKRQLAGEVRIDSLAGPTEVAIVADSSADPAQDRGGSDRAGRARPSRAQRPHHRRRAARGAHRRSAAPRARQSPRTGSPPSRSRRTVRR